MLLTRSIFVLMISMFCVVHNAVADCTSGKTTLKDGKQFTEPVNLKKCESLQAQITDKKANSFKLSCNKTKFKCTAYACPNNTVLNRNGICSETDSTQPDEQSRFHKKLLTYTDQTRNFFDACTNFSSENAKDRTIKETQSVIKEISNKIKYACITDFANVKISTALAIGVIERYNWSNGIGQIRADSCTTQQNNRFKSGAGRSIRCVSDNGIFVEFVFGKMDSLSTSREDVAEAMCPTFGFSHLDSNGNRHRCHKKDKNKSSKDLAEFLKKNELMDVKNLDNGYIEILPLHPNIETKDNLSKILYTDEFKNIITYATAQTKNLLKKYIKTRLKAAGYEVNRIRFFSARSNAFYTADGSSWPVEIEACKNNDCKTYYKVFKFKSLFGSPGNDLHFASWVALSVEQMACIIKDGLFDSKHCFFLEEDINKEKQMCAETNSLIQSTFAKPSNNAKAEFDTENNMCVLHSSNINAKTLKGLGIAAQVGLLAVTTVATAGAGTALGIGLAAGGLLADGVTLWADVQMNKASMKFLKLSTRCYDKTCAKKYFEEEFKHMLQLMDRINDDEYKVIDSEMDRLVNLFADDEKYLNKYVTELANLKEKTTGFFNNMSTEETIETVAIAVSVVLSITNATKPIKALIAKSKKVEPKFIKTLANKLNTKEAIPTATKTAGKTNDATDAGKTSRTTETVNKTQVFAETSQTSMRNTASINIQDIRMKANKNFDRDLNYIQNGQTERFYVKKTNLSDEEWKILREDLNKKGFDIAESDDPASFWITKKASNSDNIIKINSGDVGDYLSRSKTLQNLNGQGRLNLQTSKTLNGKQYMRISMGTNPDMQETQKLIRELQNEGFYVSSNSTKGGEKFIGVSRENIFEPWAKAKSNWLLNNADNVVYTEKTASKSTAVTTTKPKAPTINKEPSLSEIDDMYQQKLSDDVLTLQQSQDMGQKVDKYNDVLNRAKKSLSPEEYKTFENMLDYETTIRNQESYISQVEQNLRRNGFSEHTIDSYINDTREALAENKMKLRNMRKTNPEAAEFLDDNYSSLMDPHSIITQSDNALIQKKVNMTAEISKHVDDVALRKGVEQFKSDIIANFPESMYQKAKNWDNISGEDKANFIAKELIPYLEKIQGVNGTEIEIKLLPRSHIGGNAAFCDKTNCIQVSFEAINETRFEDVLTSLTHETVHAGQYIDGGRSLLTKEMVNLSDNNYVAALRNLGANKANAVEREAYMTEGMFNNILDEIARYHNW